MRTTKVDASALLLGIIIALLGAGIFIVIRILRVDPIEGALSSDRVINTLFVFEAEDKPIGIYVLMYYPLTKRAAVFDIPPNVGLIIQKIKRVDGIDTVYDPHNILPFQQEVETLLGAEMNYWSVVTMTNLGRLVDLFEGVEVLIPSPVQVYNETPPVLFPAGVTRLDGDKAQTYLTYVLPDESADVITARRQHFFRGFIKSIGEHAVDLNNTTVAQLCYHLMRTNMNIHTMTRMFGEYQKFDADQVLIQEPGGNLRDVSGRYLVFPYYDGTLIKDIVRQALRDLTRPLRSASGERVLTVEVLNGTATAGLARRTADMLQGFGYEVTSVGNTETDYDSTVIIDRSGNENLARSLADLIRCTNIRFEAQDPENLNMDMTVQNLEYRSDFILIIGSDFNGRYVSGNS